MSVRECVSERAMWGGVEWKSEWVSEGAKDGAPPNVWDARNATKRVNLYGGEPLKGYLIMSRKTTMCWEGGGEGKLEREGGMGD